MKKLLILFGVFALLIFSSANTQASNLTVNPLIDGMCHNGEGYNNSEITCLHALGSPNENNLWVGDDVLNSNGDMRAIWSFNISSIPIGSTIETAQFCTYILQSFGDQQGSANYAPIGIGDLNFYPINITENYINSSTNYLWNSTPIFSTVVDSDNFANTSNWINACIQGDCSGGSISASGNNLVVSSVASALVAGRSIFNLSGDFSFRVMINNTDWASYESAIIQIFKDGEVNTSNSANRITLVKPYPTGDYVSFYYYDAIDNIEHSPNVDPYNIFEYNDSQKWIRVDRIGRFLYLYKSTDGTNWTQFYVDESLSSGGIGLNNVNVALGTYDGTIQYYGGYTAGNYSRLRMGFDYPVSYAYNCWDFADWAEQMLPTGRFTIRAEPQLADGDSLADFVQTYNMDSGTNPPYLYLEYEAPNVTEELIINWISPTPNNSIINTTDHITFKVNLSETPLICNLSINNTANVSMTINMTECSYTTPDLENGTYCGVVVANDDDEANTSSVQCAVIAMSEEIEPLNLTWFSPLNNTIIISNSITWIIDGSEDFSSCLLSINNSANASMTINGSRCSFTKSGLSNATTYCAKVFAFADIGESNESSVLCATASFSTPPPSPIDNLGLFSGVALLLMGAGILLFLLEGLFGSASEMLRDPKKLVTIIIGGVILVAVLSALL